MEVGALGAVDAGKEGGRVASRTEETVEDMNMAGMRADTDNVHMLGDKHTQVDMSAGKHMETAVDRDRRRDKDCTLGKVAQRFAETRYQQVAKALDFPVKHALVSFHQRRQNLRPPCCFHAPQAPFLRVLEHKPSTRLEREEARLWDCHSTPLPCQCPT